MVNGRHHGSGQMSVSISAAVMLRELFAQDAPAVGVLFDAVVELLIRVGRKHLRPLRRLQEWPDQACPLDCLVGAHLTTTAAKPLELSSQPCPPW